MQNILHNEQNISSQQNCASESYSNLNLYRGDREWGDV